MRVLCAQSCCALGEASPKHSPLQMSGQVLQKPLHVGQWPHPQGQLFLLQLLRSQQAKCCLAWCSGNTALPYRQAPERGS